MVVVAMNPDIDNKGGINGSFPVMAELSDFKIQINNNAGLRGFHNFDTGINHCATCTCQLLQFVVAVHCHDIHTVHVQEEEEER